MKIEKPDRKRTVRLIAASLIGVIIVLMIFFLSKSVYTSSNYYYPTETFVQLESGKSVTQILEAPGASPVLESVSVTFATNARTNEGNVRIEFLKGEDVLTGWNISAAELLDNAIREFKAPSGIKLEDGGVYSIRITEEFEGENNIAVGSALTGNLSCYMTAYNSAASLKWAVLMSLVFILGYVLLILKGGLLEIKVPSLLITGAVAVLVIFILEFDLFPRVLTKLSVKPVPDATGVWDTIAPGEQKNYTFSYYGDKFEDLEIFTAGDNACDYAVSLVNETDGTTYFASYPVSPDLRVSTGRLCMMLKTSDSVSGRRYYENGDYVLTILNISPDKSLDIELAGAPSEGETGMVTFAGIRHTDLGVKLATLAVVMIFLYVVALCVIRTNWELTAERFFLVTAIPLSLLYLLVFQPWTVPDCGAHFLASYRISNLMIGINGDREWMARACDAAYYNSISWWTERKPDLEGISMMLHGLREKTGDVTLVDVLPHEDKMKYYSFICYLPQALGLTIGRLVGANTQVTILLARLMTLTAYITCCYRAVKNTPVGKIIFASLALIPVSMMMSSSFSYDSMIVISVLSFTAIILKLRGGYTRGAFIEALVWAFILGAVKGGAGLLILPVALILIKKDKKAAVTTASVIVCALLSVLLFNKILPSDELFQFGEEGSGKMMTAFVYQQPVEYLRMLVRTYLYYADSFLNEAFGSRLSYLEPTMTTLTSAGAVITALVLSTFEKDTLELKKADRILFVALSIFAFIAVPSMLLSYTPAGSGVIYGIQGRYFFQIMPILMLAVTKFGLRRSRLNCDGDTGDAAVRTGLNVYVVFTVLMVYLMMKLYLTR